MDVQRTTPFLLAMVSLPGVGPAAALKAARYEDAPPPEMTGERVAAAQEQIDAWQQRGVLTVGFYDPGFPGRLRDIPSPPAVLWMRGDPAAAATGRALAVVGTRQPSRFGVTATDTLAGAAARDGAAIISGLALGVDSVSHRAALAQQAATVAVLGGGVDRPRDPKLAQAILDAGGLLMSEQPPGAPSSPQTLVARNRLQSGLAGAVLVAQTALTGGTPHTARFAAAQNRPVFCPSPPGDHPASAGLHVLLNAPAAELPAVMPAFASAKRLCQSLGQAPLARPVSRDNVRDLLDALG